MNVPAQNGLTRVRIAATRTCPVMLAHVRVSINEYSSQTVAATVSMLGRLRFDSA